MRARTFFAESQGEDVAEVEVPVVGGHAGVTILPLFSQASPFKELPHETAEALTRRTQDGGTEVVQAKAGKARAARALALPYPIFSRRAGPHGRRARSRLARAELCGTLVLCRRRHGRLAAP